jgi:hypothetical protein
MIHQTDLNHPLNKTEFINIISSPKYKEVARKDPIISKMMLPTSGSPYVITSHILWDNKFVCNKLRLEPGTILMNDDYYNCYHKLYGEYLSKEFNGLKNESFLD